MKIMSNKFESELEELEENRLVERLFTFDRLNIILYLKSNSPKPSLFSDIKKLMKYTDTQLMNQIIALEKYGLLQIKPFIKNTKTHQAYYLTTRGNELYLRVKDKLTKFYLFAKPLK